MGATEIDVHFNVNVNTHSDGLLEYATGGHADTAAGAKLTIITTPLIRGRIPVVVDDVVVVSTPGESVDVLVTDYGILREPSAAGSDRTVEGRENSFEDDRRSCGIWPTVSRENRGSPFLRIRSSPLSSTDGTLIDVLREIEPGN